MKNKREKKQLSQLCQTTLPFFEMVRRRSLSIYQAKMKDDSWILSHLVSVSKAAGGGTGGERRSDESGRSAAQYFVTTSSQKPRK